MTYSGGSSNEMDSLNERGSDVRPGVRMAVLIFGMALFVGSCSDTRTGHEAEDEPSEPMIRLAILGDSDSHAYADTLWFPMDSHYRGGARRAQTFQWTEVLLHLRRGEIDQGRWGTWGTSPRRSRIAGIMGIQVRSPQKQDLEYNFAWTGAVCEHLVAGPGAQVKHLTRSIERDPRGWQRGVVQVRIGINELGTGDFLQHAAEDGLGQIQRDIVLSCVHSIRMAVSRLLEAHASVRIVLVGILNNVDWPPFFDRWHSAEQLGRINEVLDLFDRELRALADESERVRFFDHRANFAHYWGTRGADGGPAYTHAEVVDGVMVGMTQGDEPWNAVVADGHFGTLANLLWARDFILFLNESFAMGLTPISDGELAAFIAGVVQ